MPRTLPTLLALATLSAAVPLLAQSAYSAGPGTSSSSFTDPGYSGGGSATQPAAPIERSFTSSDAGNDNGYPQPAPYTQAYDQGPQGYSQGTQGPSSQPQRNATSEPVHGVWLVTAPDAAVQTVSTAGNRDELRVEHGRANITVHHPSDHSEILVDLPAGQVSLLKDGLYTFNADTNTVRVLRGEAEVAVNGAKPVKIKEDHQFVVGAGAKSQEADPNEIRADLLQANYGGGPGYRHGDGYGYGYGQGFYGYGPYAYGYPGYGYGYGYPYYAFGGPFGYGYPYGYGYGFGYGIGLGYYGGFGGFRGGYGGFGGFRGRR